MNQADRVRARLLQLISSASDDELFKINDTLAEAGHLDLSRCLKPGSPFPLFDLPLELLEHSARYLSRHEAASMLTVNRIFHDVFARVAWRSIRARQITESKIQLSALNRYGHLVNHLIVGTDGFVAKRHCSLIPNVMSVSIINDASGSSFQAGQLDSLRNLRKVAISVTVLNKVVFDLLGKWINSDSLSGHVNAIELIMLSLGEWPNRLVSLYSRITNKKRIQISLSSFRDSIPENTLVDMASSFTQLYISFSGCSGRYFNSIYRSSNVTFPFITKFGLVVCCAGRKKNSLLGMTSERFPSVRKLDLEVSDKECAHQNGSLLPIMLSRPWLSVTQLKLGGHVKQNDHVYVASALSNLITLDYDSNMDSYDLGSLLLKLKFLQALNIRHKYSQTIIELSGTIVKPNKAMNRLRSIKLHSVALTTDMVRFIFYCCPNLMELEIWDCTVSNDVVEHANEISKNVKSPVRHLRLKGYSKNQLDLWAGFISNFKNLKEILVAKYCDGAEYLAKELTERFPFAKVEQY
ncbi:hypothetical protein GQ42DRAFT_62951 [Ramicandelaber brevisporus]|nr:hypothetical protein GQ42DRAFT_62951 [Ramicandelaber brevisporus]